MNKKGRWNLPSVVLIVVICSACGVPRGGVVLSVSPLKGGGVVDRSNEYDGLYLRVTSDPNQIGRKGGAENHTHNFAHVHEGILPNATSVLPPLGISVQAASGMHRHSFTTSSQTPEISSTAPNDFSHINVGFFVREKIAFRVPKGAIIGFSGTQVPKGWVLLDGSNGKPDFDGLYLRIGAAHVWGQVHRARPHAHNVGHTHTFVIQRPNPSQGINQGNFTHYNDGQPVAPIEHTHNVENVRLIEGELTQQSPMELPAIRLSFLMAEKDGARLPRGALLFTTKKEIPSGWVQVGQSLSPLVALNSVEGQFLIGRAALGSAGVQESASDHRHMFDHAHHIELSPTVEASARKARTFRFPEIALASHTHPFFAALRGYTGWSEHLPPYVEMILILKTR